MYEVVIGLLAFVFGVGVGGGVVGAIGSSREKRAHNRIEDLRDDLADASARLEETQHQLARSQAEYKKQNGDLRRLEAAWTRALTQLEEKERNLAEQKALLEQAKTQLSNTFKALAAEALATNNRGFIQLADEKFKAFNKENTAELEARKVAIESLVKPVSETLAKYQAETTALEERRQKEMGSVGEQLRAVAQTQSLLHAETNKLVNALKAPQVRGRWGEVALRRTAELAGMSSYCDFEEQVTVSTEDGWLRPDMRVRLPAGRGIVVDSKVPLGGFLDALEVPTDEQRAVCLAKHAKQVAAHVDKLAAKEYWRQFESSPEFVLPEFVILFIPNDSFLAAAAEQNPDLVEIALAKRVVLATPTTLVALLRAIEYGWRQQIAVENALKIRNLGQELSDRFSNLVKHLTRVGGALAKSVEAYNSAVGTFENRILPTARKFKELGAVGRKEIEILETVDERPRDLPIPDEEAAEE